MRIRKAMAAGALGQALLFIWAGLPDRPAMAQEATSGQPPPPVESAAPAAAAPALAAAPGAARARFGLALSGGGARGLAHIGVLKVLEELRVPIDFIAGTSMGAIVGGLYADLPYRRKQDNSSAFIDFEFGLRSGRILLPRGLIAGQKLKFLFKSLTTRAAFIDDFDRLPIPFRAVATDLADGSMVVLSRGDLADALCASMSLPGTLAPAEIDGRHLVDGGLVRNLPVDVARDMGADLVIAVDVTTPFDPVETLKTLADVTRQVADMLTQDNVTRQAVSADVLIRPDLATVSASNFAAGAEALRRGEEATRAQADVLRRYSLPPGEFEARLREVRGAPAALPTRIGSVRIEGASRVDRRIVERRIRTRSGSTLDLGLLQADLSRLYGLGDFEKVDYRLSRTDGGADLLIHAAEKPWGPNYLRFGLTFVNDLEGDSDYGIRARYTRTRVDALGAEWRSDVKIGRDRRLTSEFHQPLDFSGVFFVAPSVSLFDQFVNLYDGDQWVAEYEPRGATVALDAGAELDRYGEVRLGVVRGRVRGAVAVGTGNLPEFDIATGGFTGRVVIDRLDSPYFPSRGRYGLVDLFLSRRSLVHRGRHRIYVALDGGTNLGTEVPIYDDFSVGGFGSLSGFKEGQLRGPLFGVARLGYYVRSGGLSGRFGRGVYLGGWVEAGNAWATRSEARLDNLIYSGTVGAGVDTFLGPVYLVYGHSDDGHGSLYLSLGRTAFTGTNASVFRSY
ncbi:MAG: esterase [Acidobacteria bacterium]|nr:MAG: esterase [Acidobacteriota bacterium]